jgi:hypothetical protein
MATTLLDTFDTVSIDSPEGKRFLRRVANRPDDGWTFWATAANGWRGEFRRAVDGKRPGDACAIVTIETDISASVTGRPGDDSDSDGPRVFVPEAKFVHTHGPTVAALLLAGFRLTLSYSRGSIKTRNEGLGFVAFGAYPAGVSSYRSVDIETVITKNGKVICGSSICLE